MNEDDARFERIANIAMQDADRLKSNAGHAGEMHDGGAGRIRSMVSAWKAGLNREGPKEFSDYEKQERRETDPEFAEYQRLRKKFD